jgi:hypothetical protein
MAGKDYAGCGARFTPICAGLAWRAIILAPDGTVTKRAGVDMRYGYVTNLALAASFALTAPVAAQQLDVSGQWRNGRPFGNFDIVLQQNGNSVGGTYHLGKINGVLDGNVLTGSFSDIMAAGQFRLTFSADGNSFSGDARTGSGVEHWTGVRIGTLATTPEGILRARAKLDQVQAAGGTFEQQARTACKNLFTATYYGAGDTWTTSQVTGPNPFTQVLGAVQGTSYAQVSKVAVAQTIEASISPAEQLNGLQYRAQIGFTGQVFRGWSGGNWQPWQDLGGRSFVNCSYQVKNGAATISAVELLSGIELERLTRPSSIPGG